MVMTPRVEIFLQICPENGFALCSLELLPSHLQSAQLHPGVVLGGSPAGRGWESSGVSRADFRAQQPGAGSPSNGLQYPAGTVRNVGAGASPAAAPSMQHPVPSTQHLARCICPKPLHDLVSPGGVPPELSGSRVRGPQCSPQRLVARSLHPAVRQRPPPAFERTKPPAPPSRLFSA